MIGTSYPSLHGISKSTVGGERNIGFTTLGSMNKSAYSRNAGGNSVVDSTYYKLNDSQHFEPQVKSGTNVQVFQSNATPNPGHNQYGISQTQMNSHVQNKESLVNMSIEGAMSMINDSQGSLSPKRKIGHNSSAHSPSRGRNTLSTINTYKTYKTNLTTLTRPSQDSQTRYMAVSRFSRWNPTHKLPQLLHAHDPDMS